MDAVRSTDRIRDRAQGHNAIVIPACKACKMEDFPTVKPVALLSKTFPIPFICALTPKTDEGVEGGLKP